MDQNNSNDQGSPDNQKDSDDQRNQKVCDCQYKQMKRVESRKHPCPVVSDAVKADDYAVGLFKRIRRNFDREKSLTEGADTFLCVGNGIPPFNQAKNGILLMSYPMQTLQEWIEHQVAERERIQQKRLSWLARLMEAFYLRREWGARLSGYRCIIVPSLYARAEVWKQLRIWGKVVYPPLIQPKSPVEPDAKRKSVVFYTENTGESFKTQLNTALTAFAKLLTSVPEMKSSPWELLVPVIENESMSENVKTVKNTKAAENVEAVLANYGVFISEPLLKERVRIVQVKSVADVAELVFSSALLWDFTGYRPHNSVAVTDSNPASSSASMSSDSLSSGSLSSPFPIISLSAMNQQTVPLCFCSPAASEGIIHGQSGFLWHDENELCIETARLIIDQQLRSDLGYLGHVRGGFFSDDMFNRRMKNCLG